MNITFNIISNLILISKSLIKLSYVFEILIKLCKEDKLYNFNYEDKFKSS